MRNKTVKFITQYVTRRNRERCNTSEVSKYPGNQPA